MQLSEEEKEIYGKLSARVASGEVLTAEHKEYYEYCAWKDRRANGADPTIPPEIELASKITSKGYDAVAELEKDGIMLSKEEKFALVKPFIVAGMKIVFPGRYDEETGAEFSRIDTLAGGDGTTDERVQEDNR